MRASIIIVAYNSCGYLKACLDSVLAELGPEDELIVVDNGSTDGSPDLVEGCYPHVHLIKGKNSGYAGGNNVGAAAARGDFLVFLNPDTVMRPGALSALVEPFGQHPAVGLTTACIVLMDRPDTVNTCGNTMHYTGLTYCRGMGRPRSHYSTSGEVDAVSGAAFAIKRTLFAELGGFDEQFFMYVEDSDLSLRARLAGFRCWYSADSVVLHDYRPSYTPGKAFYLERNRHLMLLKTLSGATYARALPGLLLGEVVTGGFMVLKGRRFWAVKPRVYRWLWRQRSAIRRARTGVIRRKSDRELLGHLTYHLEIGQLAGRGVARMAEALLHPAFRAARRLLVWRAA